ncbi:DUF3067 family protein [Alkalinema sp. FACHB-956]|uniref:DUF3067 family protein n=1 Tax=Alkalinema sp. FACHB-956 TaxID=2692768 RepID=UPI0016850D60|nr:DUF3067 family protein [Alkalinema sp. FACHB-956]MBD2326294.1 DUF3067 family protein [Alkalinema sp. FACHB-956]
MTGQDLQEILINKWGFSYDIQLRQVKGKIFVQVMWKYLEQASFGATEEEYVAHLNWVLSHLEAWGVVEQVSSYVEKTREKPRIGKAVSIPVDLGDRASEWLLEDL